MITLTQVAYVDSEGRRAALGIADDLFQRGGSSTPVGKHMANVRDKQLTWQLSSSDRQHAFPYITWHAELSDDRQFLLVQCTDPRLTSYICLYAMPVGQPAKAIAPPGTSVFGRDCEGYLGCRKTPEGLFVVDCIHSRERVAKVVFNPATWQWGPVVGTSTVGMRY